MAQTPTINPYIQIGSFISSGLNAIIAALPVNPTQEDLLTEVSNYVESVFYSGANTQVQIELYSIAATAANSYRNNLVLNGNALYNSNQMPFVQMLIGPQMNTSIAPDSFSDRLADIEDNIGTSELTVSEQMPLFLSTTIGRNASGYWAAQLVNPQSAWISYFSSNAGQNYMNTLLWNTAAMNGALAGAGATFHGLVEPTVNAVTNQMVSALIGALTTTAGKVIFNWIPKITKPLQLNIDRISNILNGDNPDTNPNMSANCFTMITIRKHCRDSKEATAHSMWECGKLKALE